MITLIIAYSVAQCQMLYGSQGEPNQPADDGPLHIKYSQQQ